MEFGFSQEEERFRQDVREFIRREATEEVLNECSSVTGTGPNTRAFLRKLGAKGWLAPSLPEEYGGMGASHIQRLILQNEMLYRRAVPIMQIGTDIAAPTLLMYGSEEQKREFIPKIARGEIDFALGYSEPEAGSDLAALDIRAVENGDYFIINGRKIFNTGCHYAEYHWLGARTDTTAPKHRGISLIIVDMKTPGITVNPLWTMDGERTNEVFYDDVRVPQKNLVGEKNRGFYYIATALAFERNFPMGRLQRDFEELTEYVKETELDGKLLSGNLLVRQRMAQLATELEIGHLLSYRVALMADKNIIPEWEAPMIKMFGTELMKRMATVGMEIMGLYGQLSKNSEYAAIGGRMEYLYRHSCRRTISGGSSEIMRNTIAQRGLKLPRE